MAVVGSYDKTANTMGRTVDSLLWPMLVAKSQLLDRVPKVAVDNIKYEWESANTRGKYFTAAATSTATEGVGNAGGAGKAANYKIGCGTGLGKTVQVGSLLKNATQASPIGTYGADEILAVTANNGTDITVRRNYAQPPGSTGGADGTRAGFASSGATDSYEILFSPKGEGSSPDENKYTDVSIQANYTNIVDFYLTVTGSQLASKRLLAADSLQRQFDDRLVELKNELESMLLYGAVNPGVAAQGSDVEATWQGSATAIRSTKGFQQFVNQTASYTNGVLDYATKDVTEPAINNIMANMMVGGVDMSDPFILCAHPQVIRKISAFGADKVRITQAETKWGRALKTLETDLGVDLELCPVMTMSKSDLFIIDMKKIWLAEFRPFVKLEWGIDTSTPDGTDAWKQRYLGEYGVKVVDATKSHGAIQYMTW